MALKGWWGRRDDIDAIAKDKFNTSEKSDKMNVSDSYLSTMRYFVVFDIVIGAATK